MVGAKCTLLARMDAYGQDPSGQAGEAMKVRTNPRHHLAMGSLENRADEDAGSLSCQAAVDLEHTGRLLAAATFQQHCAAHL